MGTTLDHQFVTSEAYPAQGVWFEDNGSIVCRWWWEESSQELVVRYGSETVRQRVARGENEEAWREALSAQALELVGRA